MKSYRIIAFAAVALALVSCGRSARISGTVKDAAGASLVVRTPFEVLDTLSLDASGSFRFNVPAGKEGPEIVYLYKGERKLASAIVSAGDKVTVSADTLGNYPVEGSEESALLAEVESAYAGYVRSLDARSGAGASPRELAQVYLDHYRQSVLFVVEHPASFASLSLLFEGSSEGAPTFSQPDDAIRFRFVCDTLRALYPDSRYVKSLEKEAERRENLLALNNSMKSASEISFPDLNLPGIDGKAAVLSSLDAKAVLVYFWTSADAAQKMYNQDVLKPVYAQYHGRGLEIYSVCLDPDKVA